MTNKVNGRSASDVGQTRHARPQEYKVVAMTTSEFLEEPFPAREMLMYPWLPKQGLAMVFAPRGVGKTFFSLSVAHAVATGQPLGHWTTPKKWKVLYIDGEMPAREMQDRLKEIANTESDISLSIITPDVQPLGMPDLSTISGQAAIAEHVAWADLIVVDNLSTLSRTGKENEAESWTPIQEWALFQRSRGKTILFVHHAGKGGMQRGSSRKEDVLDTVIALRHANDYSPDKGAEFELHFEKNRGFYGEEAKAIHMRYVEGSWIFQTAGESTYERTIALYLQGKKQTEIAEVLGVHPSTVSRNLQKAQKEGRLHIAPTI